MLRSSALLVLLFFLVSCAWSEDAASRVPPGATSEERLKLCIRVLESPILDRDRFTQSRPASERGPVIRPLTFGPGFARIAPSLKGIPQPASDGLPALERFAAEMVQADESLSLLFFEYTAMCRIAGWTVTGGPDVATLEEREQVAAWRKVLLERLGSPGWEPQGRDWPFPEPPRLAAIRARAKAEEPARQLEEEKRKLKIEAEKLEALKARRRSGNTEPMDWQTERVGGATEVKNMEDPATERRRAELEASLREGTPIRSPRSLPPSTERTRPAPAVIESGKADLPSNPPVASTPAKAPIKVFRLRDGTEIRAARFMEGEYSYAVTDLDGKMHEVPKADVVEIRAPSSP